MKLTHNDTETVNVVLDETEFNWLIGHLTAQGESDKVFADHFKHLREEVKKYAAFDAATRTAMMTIPFEQLAYISTLFINSAGIAHIDYKPAFTFEECLNS